MILETVTKWICLYVRHRHTDCWAKLSITALWRRQRMITLWISNEHYTRYPQCFLFPPRTLNITCRLFFSSLQFHNRHFSKNVHVFCLRNTISNTESNDRSLFFTVIRKHTGCICLWGQKSKWLNQHHVRRWQNSYV